MRAPVFPAPSDRSGVRLGPTGCEFRLSQAEASAAEAVDRAGFSARGADRALRVARTIADLAGDERVRAICLAEALQYRANESSKFAMPT